MISLQDILGGVAAVFVVVGFVPYVISVFQRRTNPHFFTWLVWAIITSIIFAIQLDQHAGAGAWSTGLTAFSSISILVLSWFYGEKKGSTLDWAALLVSLAAIPVWVFTKDPTAAAVLLTFIDVVAFYPTVSKTYRAPYNENLFYYCVWMVRYPLSFFALANMNLANTAYPATWSVLSFIFVAMMLVRRKVIKA